MFICSLALDVSMSSNTDFLALRALKDDDFRIFKDGLLGDLEDVLRYLFRIFSISISFLLLYTKFLTNFNSP